jgi:hyperosmotically inducible periplasmic protein
MLEAKVVRNVAGGFMIKVNRQAHKTFNVRSLAVLLLAVAATLAAACAATPTRESTGGYVDDSTITAKIKTNLLQDYKVSATNVDVKTYKGVVDLSGFVNSQSEISEAGLVAGQVSGVRSVHNNLIVKGAVAPPTAAEKRAE